MRWSSMRIAFVIHFATFNLLSFESIVNPLKEQPSSATGNLLNLHHFSCKHGKKKLRQAFESYETTLNKRTQSNWCALCFLSWESKTLIARMSESFLSETKISIKILSRETSGGFQQSVLITLNNLQWPKPRQKIPLFKAFRIKFESRVLSVDC